MNADGDFYVEDNCCTACGVPESIAPDLFSYEVTEYESRPGKKSKQYHCFFSKQPKSSDEINRTLDVIAHQEINCIRYKGEDNQIVEEMKKKDLQDFLDE
jgi:ferredoxin